MATASRTTTTAFACGRCRRADRSAPCVRYPTVGDVSLSPDGRTLAVTVAGGRRQSGRPRSSTSPRCGSERRLSGDEAVWDLARFTPDGRFLVGGSWKGWVRLWSTKTWKPASRPLTGHAGAILGQSMSPDGRTLATGSADGTIRLWDLRTQQPLGAPLPGLPNRGVVPQFSPDGAHLFAVTTPGAPTAGTCDPPRGRARPVRWPAARSLDPSGKTRCPTGRTTQPADADADEPNWSDEAMLLAGDLPEQQSAAGFSDGDGVEVRSARARRLLVDHKSTPLFRLWPRGRRAAGRTLRAVNQRRRPGWCRSTLARFRDHCASGALRLTG